MKNKKGKMIVKKNKLAKPKKVLVAGKNKIKKLKRIAKKEIVKKIPKVIARHERKKIKNIAKKKLNISKKTVLQKNKNTKKTKIKLKNKKEKIVIEKFNTVAPLFSAESFFKAKIKVIGIGGGGGSIVSEIGKTLKKATFVVADTDIRSIKKRSGIRYFLFGQEITHGLGTGADPEIAKKAALSEQEKIESLFRDQDIVILIVSLGGGVGSGATEVFAKMASSFGAITLGIFTLPFKFEGKTKSKIALKALKELREMLNVSITIPNENIFKIIDQNTPITQAFSVVNKNMVNSLDSLIDLIYNPGTINIDFADLRSILRGKGSVGFLNTIEESGKNRAEEIANKILINPLYKNNNFSVDKILFNIAGSSDMSMFEVEKISNKISEINSKAKIIFGISKNSSSTARAGKKIKTTLLMTGCPIEKETEKEEIGVAETSKINESQHKETIEIINKPVFDNLDTIVVNQEKKKKIENKTKLKEKKTQLNPKIILPVFKKERELNTVGALDKKLSIIQIPDKPAKKAIRRNALEIKKAEEDEQNKRLAQEQEWEIPTFLRRVKFKS